jgi:hypothetical protein
MRIPRPVAAIGVAGFLAVAAPVGLAHADAAPQPRATGNFYYWNYNDGQVALVNPPSDRCLQINADNIAGPITNLTDRNALVFTGPSCDGVAFPIFRGASTYVPFEHLKSVLFPAG